MNQIPVLDKGYVQLYSSSIPRDSFKSLHLELFRKAPAKDLDVRLLDITTIHIAIKCPLFVQLSLSEWGLIAIANRSSTDEDAYIPTVAEVNAIDLEASEAIQKDIEHTTAALLLNPKAYQMEKCDIFVSQVISPVSVYNTLMVTGSLSQWMKWLSQVGLPRPIEQYRIAIEGIIHGEYDFLTLHKSKRTR